MQSLRSTGLALLPLLAMPKPVKMSAPGELNSGYINCMVDSDSSGGSGDTVQLCLSSSQPSSSLTSSTESPQATSSSLPLPTSSIEPSDKSLELSTWLYPTLGGVGVLIAIGIVICCIVSFSDYYVHNITHLLSLDFNLCNNKKT